MKTNRNIERTFGLLALVTLVICVDLIFRFFKDDSILINEAVEFGNYTNDVTRIFLVEKDGILKLETFMEFESGELSISIISPSEEVVYSVNSSLDEPELIELAVSQGEWKYRVESKNATNGKYTIVGKKVDIVE